MNTLETRPLDETTWPDFAALVESQGGVWGGCWCISFHRKGTGYAANREAKHQLVRDGSAHAALVFDGAACVGWCQFGPTGELPRIKHGRAYESSRTDPLPDWRITCFYVHKQHRRRGVAAAGLAGALAEIARLGGGVVESYPEDATGRTPSSSFLHNGTTAMFARAGFTRIRQLGKHHWVYALTVPGRPASPPTAGV